MRVCIYIYTYIHMRGEIRRRRPNSCLPSRRLVENHEGIRRGVRASCPPRGKKNKREAARR